MNGVNSDKRGCDKMIIQTGMRTDIPAFYSKWFLNRIKEGYVCVRNPYNPKQVTKYSLSPEVVDLIAFCTKNPLPMLPFLDELKPYGQYWFVTITPYGRDIEPNVPDKETVMEGFKELPGVVCSIIGAYCQLLGAAKNNSLQIERYLSVYILCFSQIMSKSCCILKSSRGISFNIPDCSSFSTAILYRKDIPQSSFSRPMIVCMFSTSVK